MRVSTGEEEEDETADIVGNTIEGAQVSSVSLDFVYLVNERLFKEQLADMLDVGGRESVGTVLRNGPIDVDSNMDVGRTRSIVSWEDGKELCYAILVSCSESAEERRVVSGSVCAECDTIEGLDSVRVNSGVTTVNTICVAMPEVNISTLDRLACIDIDQSDIQVQIDALSTFTNIAAVQLPVNEVGSKDRVWGQYTSVVLNGRVLGPLFQTARSKFGGVLAKAALETSPTSISEAARAPGDGVSAVAYSPAFHCGYRGRCLVRVRRSRRKEGKREGGKSESRTHLCV